MDTQNPNTSQAEIQSILDAVEGSGLSALEKINLAKEIAAIKKAMPTAGALEKIKHTKRLNEIKALLGIGAKPVAEPSPAPETVAGNEDGGDEVPEPSPQAKLSLGKRQKLNNAALEALQKVKSGEASKDDPGIREALKGYSGSGGGLVTAQNTKSSPFEYYTPKPIAAASWSVLASCGFNGGKVLDPSAGMGVFAQTKPGNVMVDQIELDPFSGEINGILNDGATVSTKVSSFEGIAGQSDDETYDAVVTNVPFGKWSSRGAEWKKDKRYQQASLQNYFLLRGLEKVRPGGFAAFIVPPTIVSGKGSKAIALRLTLSGKAEFVGAYRMPNMIFDEAGADTITDLIIFRKHGKEQAKKIEEVKAQSPALLGDAKVFWREFTDGNYFKGDGLRYVLGETVMGMGKFGEVEKVANTGTIQSVAALMKPFDKSTRINWELLNSTPTTPIVYNEGDTTYFNGASMELKDGKWVPVEGGLSNRDEEADALFAKFTTPLASLIAGMTYTDAKRAYENEMNQGRGGNLTVWFRAAVRDAAAYTKDQAGFFDAVLAGMCVQEASDATGTEAINFVETQPELSRVLARVQAFAKVKSPNGNDLCTKALQAITLARLRGSFTPWWKGDVEKTKEVTRTLNQQYDFVKSEFADEMGYIPIEKMRETLLDFDPMQDDAWCISPDGKSVISADDFYQGNFGDFVRNAQQDADEAVDPEIKEKLLRQIQVGRERLDFVDVSRMTFTMDNRFVPLDEKAKFVSQYISPAISLVVSGKGEMEFKYDAGKVSKYDTAETRLEHKILTRLTAYLNTGNVTTRSFKKDVDANPEEEQVLLQKIGDRINGVKAQYDAWCRSNEEVVSIVKAKLNDPENMSFKPAYDTAPVDIENWNPERTPHGYQNAAIRRYSKNFSGILALDVGLGKTLTALATAQYCHSIGTKKKTIFVLPNSVMSNWRKEAAMAYTDLSDCLFVGMRPNKTGKLKYQASAVDEDISVIRLNRHRKIFMTFENLKKIPLRDETMELYKEYLIANDDSFLKAAKDGEMNKTGEILSAQAAAAKVLNTGDKSSAVPFFEDLGVDSLIIDECHAFKNSKAFSNDFGAAKYIPNPASSDRGMDMQAKCWYIRDNSPSGDGVLGLTATPVTNSPLEVYSMLSLTMGEREFNNLCGCTGADSFMANTCDIDESSPETDLVGRPRAVRALSGISNLAILQRVLEHSAIIETPDSVAAKGIYIKVPESATTTVDVELSSAETAKLMAIKTEYLEAKDVPGESRDEETAIKASAFNLIRRMTKLITDPELSDGRFVFNFAAADAAKAEAVKTAFAKFKIVDNVREYEVPAELDVSTLKSSTKKDPDTGVETTLYEVPVRLEISGNALVLHSSGFEAQNKLMKVMEKEGLGVSVKASAKTLAMLANFQTEQSNPRWKPVKQIIFCDELAMHHKLRILLNQECGIPLGKIAIINAQAVDPEELQGIQDGFNASDNVEDETNLYSTIIANKKAEVGINLQKGTQAIHHLTIGWTPDSIHQRNGRGVRQGNSVEGPVNVYFYDANGTFDSYRRRLVSVKGDWIESVMDKDATSARVEGDLSTRDYEEMADAVGDSAKMAQLQQNAARKAKEAMSKTVKVSQVNAISVIQSRQKWLAKFGIEERSGKQGFEEWANGIYAQVSTGNDQIAKAEKAIMETASDAKRAKLSSQIATLKERVALLESKIKDVQFIGGKASVWGDGVDKTPSYEAYKKEVDVNTKMIAEAQSAFLLRANDGGYSKDALDAFNNGDAEIFSGNLIKAGDLAITENGHGIFLRNHDTRAASKMQLYSWTKANGYGELSLAALKVHSVPGDVNYQDIVNALVDRDEATLAEGGDTSKLFARFNGAVRESLRTDIPSLPIHLGSYSLDRYVMMPSGVFPIALTKDVNESLGGIGEGQSRYIRFEDGPRYQSGTIIVFLSDKNRGEELERGEAFSRVCAWLEANGKRLTNDQWRSLSMNYEAASAVGNAYKEAKDNILAQSSNITEYDANFVNWANNGVPWFDTESIVASDIARRMGVFAAYNEGRLKSDDGSEKYDFPVSPTYAYLLSPAYEAVARNGIDLPAGFEDQIVELSKIHNAAYVKTAIDGPDYAELKLIILSPVASAMDATIQDGMFRIESKDGDIAQRLRATFKVGPGAVMVFPAQFIDPYQLQSIVKCLAADIAAKKASDSGIDIDSIIGAIRDFSGDVQDVEVGTTPLIVARDRYHGAANLEAGMYLKVFLRYKSDLSNKISDKVTGMPNRFGDKFSGKYGWVVSLSPVNYSDGKPFPTVADFAKFLGIDLKEAK